MSTPASANPPPRAVAATQTAHSRRRQLLERVADAEETHVTMRADDGHWLPYLDKVQIKTLHRSGDTLSYLLKLAPGGSVPAHRHRLDEESLVLQGSVRLGTHTELGLGAYHLAHQGTLHATFCSTDGALIFVRGAVPSALDVL